MPRAGWLRPILLERPSRIMDAAGLAYAVLLAALSLVCLITALLWLLVWLAGYPLP